MLKSHYDFRELPSNGVIFVIIGRAISLRFSCYAEKDLAIPVQLETILIFVVLFCAKMFVKLELKYQESHKIVKSNISELNLNE